MCFRAWARVHAAIGGSDGFMMQTVALHVCLCASNNGSSQSNAEAITAAAAHLLALQLLLQPLLVLRLRLRRLLLHVSTVLRKQVAEGGHGRGAPGWGGHPLQPCMLQLELLRRGGLVQRGVQGAL